MKTIAALTVLLGIITLARADQTVENIQQALKEQGFYYGEITGQKDTDTSAAIRRYQIRHGLQVTGELNDETLRSIQTNKPASPAPVIASTPAATAPPAPDTSDLRDESASEPAPETSGPVQPPVTAPQDRQLNPRASQLPPPATGELFAGTPFQGAEPGVQRGVVISAQRALARRGLYHNEFDGVFGPNLEFSLRAYQSRAGLAVTGRLDLSTLAALELLPGANEPVYVPRRRVWRDRPLQEPPVRGEWIRE
jgi:peptidoglycan hydrolase-like protein with peptidoglycan-binding domain